MEDHQRRTPDPRGSGRGEQLLIYASPALRITKTKNSSGVITSKLSILHRDGLGSVRAVTNGAGTKNERDTTRPFGEQSETVFGTAALPETRGFIGERYDADAGLEYLNARYYDPRLGMFVQPDWWEVTEAGVGTNRYAYGFDDPVNGKDASGHFQELTEAQIDRLLSGTADAFGYVAQQGLRTFGLAASLAMTPTAAGTGSDFTEQELAKQKRGVALTEDMVGQGYSVNQTGQVVDPFGDVVIDPTGAFSSALPSSKNTPQSFGSFEKLKAALGPAGPGKVWHHIVEQCQSNCTRSAFPSNLINNTKNVAAVPKEVNQRLADLYARKIPGTNMTVRDWLSKKSFKEKYEYGKQQLDKVLKEYEKNKIKP